MDRVSMKEHAKQQIRGKIFTLLAMYIIIAAVSLVASFILGGFSWIVTLLISGPITFAWASVYLGITKRSRMPLFGDLISGFKGDNFLRNFIAYLRYSIFTFLWSLLFIIPGIIKSIAYSQMFYFLAEDDKMEAGAAQRKSMEVMEGHKWEYFVLQLSFIPWHILGALTFGIAYIWVIPYMETTFAEYHVRLTGSNKPTPKAAAVKAVAKKTSSAKTAKKSAPAKTAKKATSAKATKAKSTKKSTKK